MRWLIDTNVWIDAPAGRADAENVLKRARDQDVTWAGYCVITLVESLGFAHLTKNEDLAFRKIFSEFYEVPITSEIIEQAILIRKNVRIKTPDSLIAASAIISSATLITRNLADFKNIPNLQVAGTDQV